MENKEYIESGILELVYGLLSETEREVTTMAKNNPEIKCRC
jgi:hypothetical protein